MNDFVDGARSDVDEVGGRMPQDDVMPTSFGLTDLQMKCLEGFWNRRPAKQIAADLGISEAWVHKNLMSVRRKLHVNSSAEAAAIVFEGKRDSIKSYYYQETDLSEFRSPADQRGAGVGGSSLALAASERPLNNRFGALATIAGIVLIAVGSIVGVALIIEAGQGLYQLLRAFGY